MNNISRSFASCSSCNRWLIYPELAVKTSNVETSNVERRDSTFGAQPVLCILVGFFLSFHFSNFVNQRVSIFFNAFSFVYMGNEIIMRNVDVCAIGLSFLSVWSVRKIVEGFIYQGCGREGIHPLRHRHGFRNSYPTLSEFVDGRTPTVRQRLNFVLI